MPPVHEQIEQSAVNEGGLHRANCASKELGELRLVHFARSHRKLGMLVCAEARHMTGYLDVVGQIARHRSDLPVAYGTRHDFGIGRIAAG